jgi:hypothetical protein
MLIAAAAAVPVVGNAEGSYLTMKSNAGILFGGCTIASGFSGVFCDQGLVCNCSSVQETNAVASDKADW